MRDQDRAAARAVRAAAHPLSGGPGDFDALLDLIGDAHVVLLGEASHGTHDFYRVRAEITKRLIREKGFEGVAIEGDWPDAFRVDQFVRGEGTDHEASEALSGFERFPQWMWRNADVLDFVGWLRAYNEGRGDAKPARFFGLDLYSLHRSIELVLEYLDAGANRGLGQVQIGGRADEAAGLDDLEKGSGAAYVQRKYLNIFDIKHE